MTYSKNFPRTVEGTNFPKWEEICLTGDEDLAEEKRCRTDNLEVMKECIDDAKQLMAEKGLKDYQSDLIAMAVALFRKRAAYAIHYKEQKAKEKFDEEFKE